MGDRAQVRIIEAYDKEDAPSVYLYTHWGGYKLIENVRIALQMKARWDDACYLSRIIFEQMLTDQSSKDTGFGIDTEEHGDIALLVTVNCKDQMVIIDEENLIPFLEFIE